MWERLIVKTHLLLHEFYAAPINLIIAAFLITTYFSPILIGLSLGVVFVASKKYWPKVGVFFILVIAFILFNTSRNNFTEENNWNGRFVILEINQKTFEKEFIGWLPDKNSKAVLKVNDPFSYTDAQPLDIFNVKGNLLPSEDKYLSSKGVGYILSTVRQELTVNDLTHHIIGYGDVLAKSIYKSLPKREGDLSVGLILGGDEFEKEHEQKFRDVGIAHIVVVSGASITLLISVLLALSYLVKLRVLVPIVILLIWIYLSWVGLENIPALRAVLVSTIILMSGFGGKNVSILRANIYTFAIMSFTNPSLISNVSWQLTTLALIGIHFFVRYFQLKKVPVLLGELIAMNLGVMVVMFPYYQMVFGGFPTLGLLTNLIVLPIIILPVTLVSVLLVLQTIYLNIDILWEVNYAVLRLINLLIDFIANLDKHLVDIKFTTFFIWVALVLFVSVKIRNAKTKLS